MEIVQNAIIKTGTAAEPVSDVKLAARSELAAETAFGCPRDFLDNRFVYVVISSRAHGLSVGVNLTPEKKCNFDCVYCEVDWATPPRVNHLDVDLMASEL